MRLKRTISWLSSSIMNSAMVAERFSFTLLRHFSIVVILATNIFLSTTSLTSITGTQTVQPYINIIGKLCNQRQFVATKTSQCFWVLLIHNLSLAKHLPQHNLSGVIHNKRMDIESQLPLQPGVIGHF